jgi:hypothetical protein
MSYGKSQVYTGKAYEEGKIIYTEKHEVEQKNGMVLRSTTTYFDPNGKIIAKLTNDYSKSLNLPENEMVDERQKSKHGVRYSGDIPVMYAQEMNGKEETKKIDLKDFKNRLVVGGQGLHYYLLTHMKEVIEKKNLKLKFLIPGRLDAYDFDLKVSKVAENKAYIEVEIHNWFLKLFAPKLKMIYDVQKNQLLKYEGLSNLKSANDKMMNVEILYNYDN